MSLLSRGIARSGSLAAPRFLLLALALVLVAVAADQFAAPILHSSSPLWATTACLLLVWRRGKIPPSPGDPALELSISMGRVTAFLAAHSVIILLARSLSSTLQAASGAMTVGGTLVAASKVCVLAPTMLLFPLAAWKRMATIYFPEAIAALVVLLTYFPSRALEALWPWYGQLLGRFVYTLARIFVPGLAYLGDSNPTLSGPDLDVTIVPECSGINGIELFDYLFGVVAFLDWNRLRKGRALCAYGAGLLAMLLGNAIRITSFVVLGNHGFAESVSRFHISAGWIFFSIVFLVYLSMTYGWMLGKRDAATQQQQTS
ncbi:MAG TPA: exosortase/archaeosortase family protein [Candidatus Limnocylindria bacterium]|nr:exosortase/archaeosortase family protein [Candidatus Limnocylindria bacterium]